MLARYDPDHVKARSRGGNISLMRRFLKRKRLSIRRIMHKGTKQLPDMAVNVYRYDLTLVLANFEFFL
jgi:hypothetical protein